MKFIITSLFFFSLLTSCDNEDKYIGSVPVKNSADIHIDVYQEQKFNHSVSILYKIVAKNNVPLLGPRFLIGTSDFDREDTKDFTAGSYDSFVYLTFLDSNMVYAIYDLKTNRSIDLTNLITRDTLIEIYLKKNNPRLKFSWYE